MANLCPAPNSQSLQEGPRHLWVVLPALREPDQGGCTSGATPSGQGALNFMSLGPGTGKCNTHQNELARVSTWDGARRRVVTGVLVGGVPATARGCPRTSQGPACTQGNWATRVPEAVQGPLGRSLPWCPVLCAQNQDKTWEALGE